MSGPAPLPQLSCRKCGRTNPLVYLAPVILPDEQTGSCICIPCATVRGWLDADGNLKPGIEL